MEPSNIDPVTPQSRYRRDIDGLRAIAVMSVVLFHAHFRYASGGFVGVDVFFVISGFLITNHIVREIGRGSFTFADFYERRVRRIAPALLFMMLCVLIYGYFTLMPEDMNVTGRSAIAATLSVSNFYFWQTIDYWHGGPRALIHTWSLSVEEQFYLVIPVLLFLLMKNRRSLPSTTLWTICGGSFALMCLTFQTAPAAAFYLLPQRAWELLLGGLFGLNLVPFPKRRFGREALALVGIIVILLVTVWPIGWQAPMPATILTCIASGVILAAGADGTTLTGRALSIAPMRWIGLASYSIYLWHEPVIFFNERETAVVYGRVLGKVAPFLSAAQAVTLERIAVVVGVSLGLGFLSWRFVERPFRFGAHKPSQGALFKVAAVSAAVVMGLAAWDVAGNGLPGRFPPRVIAIAQMPNVDVRYQDGICYSNTFATSAAGVCKPLAKDRPNWLLIGDSLASRLDYGLHETFPDVNVISFMMHGCKPLPDARAQESVECHDGYLKLYNEILRKNPVNLVILAANWQPYDVPRIERAVDMLRRIGQPVALVGPNMQYDMPMRLLLADAIQKNDPGLPARHRIVGYDDLDRDMAALARDKWRIPYYSFSSFCPGGRCREWAAPNVPFVFDTVHVSDEASLIIVRQMRDIGFLPYRVARADEKLPVGGKK